MKKLLIFMCFIVYAPLSIGQIIITYAGNGILGSTGDSGPATAAELETPSGVAVDKTGNVYIADQNGNKIRKVSLTGIITTVAGIGGTGGYSGDGGQATNAKLYFPTGVAADRKGNLYIADEFNDVIRKVDTAGIISTIAGDGTIGYGGDGGAATNAQLWHPADVGVDTNGNVYTVDQDNSAVRKITPSGTITTVAGTGSPGFSGDGGPATAAKLNFPQGIAVDSIGNIYVADFYNSRIRKVSVAGIITTIAGNGTGGYCCDGGPATNAEIFDASAVAVDDSGNVFISDYYNSRVRKVNTSGIITTVAGNDTSGYSGDCGPATAAEIYYPEGVAVDRHGNIYIADYNNSRVRKVTDSTCFVTTEVSTQLQPQLSVYPNPSHGYFTIQTSNTGNINVIEIYNMIGEKICQSEISSAAAKINLSEQPRGVYILYLRAAGNATVQRLIYNY